MHVVSDHGSDITATMCFLLFGLNMNGSWQSDYFHDCDNDIDLSVKDTELAPLVQDTTWLMNFEHGPHHSQVPSLFCSVVVGGCCGGNYVSIYFAYLPAYLPTYLLFYLLWFACLTYPPHIHIYFISVCI